MRKKWTSVVIVTLSLLLWFAISKGISSYLSPPDSILWRMILGTMVIPYGVALPLSYLVLRLVKAPTGEEKKSLSLKTLLELAVIQSGLSVFSMFVIQLVLIMTGLATVQEIPTLKGVEWTFYLVLLLIFNPIVEEFFFRKLILYKLLDYGKKNAILLSAALFALPHGFSQGIPQLFYTFILGIIWAYVVVKTNRLSYAIVLHSFSNLWGMILPMLLPKGFILQPLLWTLLVPLLSFILLYRRRAFLKTLD